MLRYCLCSCLKVGKIVAFITSLFVSVAWTTRGLEHSIADSFGYAKRTNNACQIDSELRIVSDISTVTYSVNVDDVREKKVRLVARCENRNHCKVKEVDLEEEFVRK